MKRLKNIAPLIAIALLGLVGFSASLVYASNRSNKYTQLPDISSNDMGDKEVKLTANGAKPDQISVVVGKSVEFKSSDGKTHSLSLGEGSGERSAYSSSNLKLAHNGAEHDAVQSDTGHESKHEHQAGFSSGEFKADEAWRVTFKEAGTYFFHDHLNPDINILVVAYEPK